MSEHVILFCNLEHLPPHDTEAKAATGTEPATPARWAFGLNLSVAVSGALTGVGLDALKPFMQPWTWPRALQVRVRVRDGATGRTTTEDIPPLLWKRETLDCCHCRDERDKLRPRLDEEFALSKAVGLEAFTWRPDGGALGKTSRLGGRPWHTFVGQLSLYPPPFAQCLNLSFVFWVNQITTAGPKSVFAAPLLPHAPAACADPALCADLSLPFGADLRPKGDEPVVWAGHPGVFQWEYETAAGAPPATPVIAHMAECTVETPRAAFLDLGSQWVGKLNAAGESDLFTEDWRAVLEERMADALDIGQRVIEFARKHPDDPTIAPQPKLFQWMTVAAIRDLAGVGFHPGADRMRFIDRAFRTVKGDPPTAVQKDAVKLGIVRAWALFKGITEDAAAADLKNKIEGRVREQFGTVEKWAAFLAGQLPEVTKLSALAPPQFAGNQATLQTVVPEEQVTVTSLVAELEQLHKAVFEPKNLALLVKEQWRVVLPGELVGLMDRVNLDELNVRHGLALENLGDLWAGFLNMPMPSAGGSGQDLVRQNFSCLFQAYFCLRFGLDLAGLTAEVGGVPRACDVAEVKNAYDARGHRQPEKVLERAATDTEPAFSLGFPVPPGVRQKIVGHIKTWSAEFVKVLLPADVATEPTDVPHAVTMQVDGLSPRPTESADANLRDILKRISGVGVLMREEGKDWRCLNFASAVVRRQTAVVADPVIVPSRLNYRNGLRQAFLSYNNHPLTAESPVSDDKMTKVSLQPTEGTEDENAPPLLRYRYSEDPVGKLLPSLKFGQTFEILPFIVANSGALPRELTGDPAAGTYSPVEARLAEFRLDKLKPGDQSKVRKHLYLRKVRIGGIRVFDEAGRVSLKLPAIPDTVFPRARDIHREALDAANRVSTGAAPAPERDPARYPLLLLAPKAWEERNTGAVSSFAFTIRKPATDLNTWDRWIAGDLPKERRASVWADFYRKAEAKRVNGQAAQGLQKFQQPDTSIDDPAALNKFYIELWHIDGTSTTVADSEWVDIDPQPTSDADPRPATEKLRSVQFERVRVSCSIGASEDINVGLHTVSDPSGGQQKQLRNVEVTVKEGEVYQLNIFSAVLKDDYTRRFADILPAKIETNTRPAPGVPVYLASTFSMLIEAATPTLVEDLPAGEDNDEHFLWKRLNPAFTPFAPGPPPRFGAIDITLKHSDAASADGFKYLYRAELLRQVWRWQGRETPLHPCLKASSPCKAGGRCADLNACVELDKWEAWEFGNRFETDHLVTDMTTQPPARATEKSPTLLGGRVFFYREVLETGDEDKDELRALHYRFAVRVFSRYAGIMPPEVQSSLLSRDRTKARREANDLTGSLWRRLFVPYRRTKPLTVPKIKLILPLTESFGAEVGNTAGLLVVLNEPWYKEAGLGEGLAAEVQTTPAPENNPTAPATTDTFFFELGADPIVAPAARGYQQRPQDPAAPFFDQACLNQKIRGPVGHTFDRTNESPLFTATSFIIPAPAVFARGRAAAQTPDFSWNFCRLRLRRVVVLSKEVDGATGERCDLTAPGAPAANCDPPAAGSRLEGPLTDPYWVQYLPEFSHFAPEDQKLAGARLAIDDANNLSILDPGHLPVPLTPTPSTGNIFELYLVLTRRVFDATGRPEQEVYVQVFRPIGNNLWETKGKHDIPPPSADQAQREARDTYIRGLRARVIEVQVRRQAPPPPGTTVPQPPPTYDRGEQLWEHMFGPEPKPSPSAPVPDKDLARIVRISEPIESLTATTPDC